MRSKSTFVYLALMAYIDLIVILFGSIRDILVYKYKIFISGPLLCRIHIFIFFLSCQLSSWLLVAANFDRFLTIIYHFQFKNYFTRKTAFKVFFILLCVLTSVNFHFLVFINSDENLKNRTDLVQINSVVYPMCHINSHIYKTFYTNYYCWIDSFVFSFIPFLILIVTNLTLIKKVTTQKRLSRSKKTSKQNNNLLKKAAKTSASSPFTKSESKEITMAFYLIGVTILFIVFTLPIK